MKVYTKRGDKGTTGLLYGGRVAKDDLRTESYGTTDEVVSALGIARSHLDVNSRWSALILLIQRQLFVVGAELATDLKNYSKLTDGVSKVTPEMVSDMEKTIDEITDEFPLPQEFIVPGVSKAGAMLDLARSITRRAERQVVTMNRHELLENELPMQFLNRLSDLLFVMARALEHGQHVSTKLENEKEA